jgi:hypothetical protein
VKMPAINSKAKTEMMAISDNSKALFFISSMSELVFVVFDHPVTTNKIEQSLLFRHLRFH